MAHFQKTVDIYKLTPEERRALQPGQWVRAGEGGPVGRYFGQRSSGSDVCAWLNNARRNYRQYMAFMAGYAREGRASASATA